MHYPDLARGINFPNWAPDYRGFKPSEGQLAELFELGFTHLRLPIEGEKLMPAFSSSEETKDFLDHLKRSVQQLQRLGFALSLDMHPGPDFSSLHETKPKQGFEQLRIAWEQLINGLSLASAGVQKRLVLELLNEPVPPQGIWWPQAQKLVTHLRKSGITLPLVVGPANYQRFETLVASKPLQGTGLIYAIHYYDPFVFTHQGISWDDTSPLKDIAFLPFPASLDHGAVKAQLYDLKIRGKRKAVEEIETVLARPWTRERIAADLQKVKEWAMEAQAPVLLNEFGVLNFAVAQSARTKWIQSVREAAEDACLGWAHWEYSDGFGFADPQTGQLDPAMIKALLE
ncbi:MAG: glycoside hydrolase family 5 protein [Cohaesibacter sp.]|nr:glycoside hydrolase family 5 protein [Cohaesibacter sp.]